MKLTIIVPDKAVYQDGIAFINLNLSSCNIPTHVKVLQFNTNTNLGWLEHYLDDFNNLEPNTPITELPTWATAAMTMWAEAEEENRQKDLEAAAYLAASSGTILSTEQNGNLT